GVLCEKPSPLNRGEAEAAVAPARRRDVFLMEAMWMRYVPAMVEPKRLLAAGAIGELVSVSADFGFSAAGLPATHRALAPELGGGGLLDIGIYPLNLAAFVLGDIVGAQADAELGPTGVDVHTVFNLRHAGGQRSQGMCSLRSTTACRATILGTDGRIDITPPFYAAQQLQLARGTRPPEETPVEIIDRPWRGNRYVHQVEEVHRCLRAGLAESPVMPLDETVALVGWMDAMRAQFGLRYPGE
ncbi:MAG: Gfo/Idh/MocA family oxidoreductase, partial [Caulobacter sp.]|nr:Gfo/Idh/MocA family oxidoreductase [Vitreoscilla sp.]